MRQSLSEELPDWLIKFEREDRFPRQDFFASRVVYYPASGYDGHAVKVFGSTHTAHCFVYVDYGVSETEIKEALDDPEWGFRGYHTFARIPVTESELVPEAWTPHISPYELPDHAYRFANVTPFAFLEVSERDPELDHEHGPCRLAILFLGGDGVASYDALFCQAMYRHRPPFAVLVQNHGFGGDYTSFAESGLLARVVWGCRVLPEYLLLIFANYRDTRMSSFHPRLCLLVVRR